MEKDTHTTRPSIPPEPKTHYGRNSSPSMKTLLGQSENARAQLAALNESAIVAFTDRRGKITFVNDKFCEISGYTSTELLGADHRIINSGFHPRAFFADMWKTILSGRVWRGEICNRSKDGNLYWVDSSIAPCFDAQGQIVEFVAVRFHITDRKKAEAELLRSNRDLEQFAYTTAHDLQSPLRSIKLYTQLLKKRLAFVADPETSELFGYVLRGSDQMDRLIQDLLTYSRLGKESMLPQRVNLDSIIDELLLGGVFNSTEVNFSRMALPTVLGHKTPLFQLFQNLLQNASKFHKNGQVPNIKLSVEERNGDWIISVADDGIGIEERDRSRLFQLFQRLETSETYQGTGIGLAICKKVVELHGGEIWIESKIRVGSRFSFTLKKLAPVDSHSN